MKKLPAVCCATILLSVLTILCGSWHKPEAMPDAIISIDANAKGIPFSLDMYGVFFEDINHSADGGLYAELIQNRDFEYNRAPEQMRWTNNNSVITDNGWRERYHNPEALFSWALNTQNGAKATIKQTSAMPLNSANPMSMELDVKNVKGGVAVINSGFWGVPVKNGAKYDLSFYARKSAAAGGTVKVSLEGSGGKIYASATISGIGSGWKRLGATLISGGTDASAHFVIRPTTEGKFWFDVVSLFPQNTYMHRAGGLRKDLVDMIAALHPSFLRFPGGCVVEGSTLENRIKWKETIGDVAKRPGNWNVWRYHTTEGLGYHEFLQLCEDLKIAPMYVINVGMSCQARGAYCVPEGDVKTYIQDSMDALEYAMGPIDSKWGAMRARNGHPAPYKIKYVEIGNENRGPYYQEAYKTFQVAVKQKYPEIITIANEPITINEADKAKHPGVNVEFVDEHYYKSPRFFYANEKHYDGYDRSTSPQIYIGEFAVNTPDGGKGNMNAAMGEAAFMTGMERNADIVKMASYAPTFVNDNDRRWMPDMIVFKGDKAYGTPSYYALKMFSGNRPDHVLPTKVTMSPATDYKNYDNLAGGFGFNNRNATVSYKDIRVIMKGKDVLNDDLKHGTGKWLIKNDNWEASNGVLTNKFDEARSNIMVVHNDWRDYTLKLKAKKISGTDGIHIFFLNGAGGVCNLNLLPDNVTLVQNIGGEVINLGKNDSKLHEGKWYDMVIDIKGPALKCFIDDKLTFDAQLGPDNYKKQLFVTAGQKNDDNEIIVKIVNPDGKGKTCRIITNGKDLVTEGNATVMTADNRESENSFADPEKIKPQTSKLTGIANSFNYRCPANSISVLRLKIKN